MKSLYFLLVSLCLMAAGAHAQSLPDTIPTALLVKKDGSLPEPVLERLVRLDTFLLNDEVEVFEAPPCLEGEFYVAFQLYHDLGNQQTTEDWTSFLEVTLLHVEDTLWTKNLQNDMASQTFKSTVFHSSPLACSQGYYLRLDKKTLTGNVPEGNLFVRMMLFPVDTLGFDPVVQPSLNVFLDSANCNISLDYNGEDAEEFDLEWVFVADYENYGISSVSDAFNVKEGVRISTTRYNYQHSMFYPDGKLYFRARAVGKDPLYPGHRITGTWAYADSALAFINYEKSKNWQSQTILAEDGKYKKILSYMDGSLHNRQTLTNLSSDTLVMIAESRYDFEGRKAIDILPAPQKSRQLTFRNNFNQFTSSDPEVNVNTATDRLKFHYDNHNARNSTLASTSGAGKYYSPNNDINTHKSYHSYIPDAKGYAYNQVEYTRDNSGRISKQSGVGEAFRMDSTHTTRYFYGTPSAAELVRLFGSNVGKASHYRKNMTVDPNGQVSVSYEDQEGRAIATALAGEKPGALAALPSYEVLPTEAITVDISDKNQLIENQRVVAHTILNTSPQTAYAFEYSLSALGSVLENGNCQSCAYDLKITLTDPDGELVNLDSAAGNMSASGLGYERHGITAADCINPTTVNDINFTDTLLKVGEYTIYKELVAQELSYEELTTMVLADTTVQARISALEQTYSLDSADCEVCTSCEDTESIINETIDEVAAQTCSSIYQQIVSYYEQAYAFSEVPQDSIEAHPDYCKYELCQKNQASKSFESQMARVADWTAAMALGYNQPQDLDPFFNQLGLSGYGFKDALLSRLNSVDIGTVQYDSNGDGTSDGSQSYSGTIWQVADPSNIAYYLDDNGNADTTGRHLLYWDLMGKKNTMNTEAYNQQLDEERWQLFKSFYLEAKMDTQLNGGIAEIDNCPSYKAELGTVNTIPTTEEGIRLWAEQNGLYQDVSNTELEYTLANIENACGTTLSTADSTDVMNALRTYFDSNKSNFFNLILLEDLGINEDSSLQIINNILSPYSCSLDSVALANPMICARDTFILLENEILYDSTSQSAKSSSSLSSSTYYSGFRKDKEKDLVLKELEKKHLEEMEAFLNVRKKKISKKVKKKGHDLNTMRSSASFVSSSDSLLLIEFYNSTGGDSKWLRNDNWLSGPISTWYGITLNSQGVSEIILPNNNLTGIIPESIGQLNTLKDLTLTNNNLEGNIPESIGLLSNLNWLLIGKNRLTGKIPNTLGQLNNLYHLDLSYNMLNDSIPSSLGQLSNLYSLSLFSNFLTGNIPESLGNLNNIDALSLGNNFLTGTIPDTLSKLSYLYFLDLSYNLLSDSIPNFFGELINIKYLWLQGNEFKGNIPSSMGQLSNAIHIHLNENLLSGSIPESLDSIEFLEHLDISENRFTFSDILPVQDFYHYISQDTIDNPRLINYPVGMNLTLSVGIDRNTDPPSKYQWFMYIESGNDIPLQSSPSISGHTMTLYSLSPSDTGKYYYQITNDAAPNLTLTSHFIDVQICNDCPGVVVCLEYAPPSLTDNPTLAAYTFDVDWNEATARCLSFNQSRDSMLVQEATEKLIEEEAINFYQSYQTNCLGQANDSLRYSYVPKEYHYTLYYYDQASNLVQTVPPKGVKPLSAALVDNFLAGNITEPNHELITKYNYNSLNQLIWQHTPDAGQSQFWYDGKGQLRLSQNAKQAAHGNYSYTKYDAQGRVIEVGQLASNTIILDSLLSFFDDPEFPLPDSNYALSDITRTYYDAADSRMQGLFAQQNLRSRVSWVAVIDSLSTDTVTTHYSYDIHGNVQSLLQHVPGLGAKRTDYVYDLVSGNVNYVFYQFGEEDQFLQRYAYDADNRLTDVKTSSDGFIWNTEATYFYYPHGPLARVVLGERTVQGLDYYYTLQGWLKGVNGTNESNDPAQDGMNGSRVGKDAIAFALGYHQGDYQGIGTTPLDNQLWTRLGEQYSYAGLHNGNIAWMQTNLPGLKSEGKQAQQAMLYQYDQLNRLVQAQSLRNFSEATGFASRGTSPEAFDTRYSYDANGNLLSLQRHDGQASLMDDFGYAYYAGTNRLQNLTDVVPPDTIFYDTKTYNSGAIQHDGKVYRQITAESSAEVPAGQDVLLEANESITLLPNFHAKAGSGFHARWTGADNFELEQSDDGNFHYDEIGNLTADSVAGTNTSWTPYGKVRQVTTTNGDQITYRYDGAGNRVEKKVVASDSSYTTCRVIKP